MRPTSRVCPIVITCSLISEVLLSAGCERRTAQPPPPSALRDAYAARVPLLLKSDDPIERREGLVALEFQAELSIALARLVLVDAGRGSETSDMALTVFLRSVATQCGTAEDALELTAVFKPSPSFDGVLLSALLSIASSAKTDHEFVCNLERLCAEPMVPKRISGLFMCYVRNYRSVLRLGPEP
jgi:hypothetical protein